MHSALPTYILAIFQDVTYWVIPRKPAGGGVRIGLALGEERLQWPHSITSLQHRRRSHRAFHLTHWWKKFESYTNPWQAWGNDQHERQPVFFDIPAVIASRRRHWYHPCCFPANPFLRNFFQSGVTVSEQTGRMHHLVGSRKGSSIIECIPLTFHKETHPMN